METEKVCEMLDTLAAGGEYEFPIDLNGNVQSFHFKSNDGPIRIHTRTNWTDITDPRMARELATALIMWANVREGTDIGLIGARLTRLLKESRG